MDYRLLLLSVLCSFAASNPQYGGGEGGGNEKSENSGIFTDEQIKQLSQAFAHLAGGANTDANTGANSDVNPGVNNDDAGYSPSEGDTGVGNPDFGKTCQHPSYDCVPYFQCIDGEINTDGAGLIDVRLRPQGVCVNAEYPDVPAICCLIPGYEPTPPPPPPVDECPYPLDCVDYSLCSADGTVNTDGTGLIDVRFLVQKTDCYLYDNTVGTCCLPPVLEYCPDGGECIEDLPGACSGESYNDLDQWVAKSNYDGDFQLCNIEGYDPGLCCKSAILDYCPDGGECVTAGSCTGEFYNDINQWVAQGSYNGGFQLCNNAGYEPGVCCKSTILDYCPENSICVADYACNGEAMIEATTNFAQYVFGGTATFARCLLDGYSTGGICCAKSNILDYCPEDSKCVEFNSCLDDVYTDQDSWAPYTSGDTWAQCALDQYTQGVCCQKSYKAADHCGVSNVDQYSQRLDTRITPGIYPGENEAQFGEMPWQAIIFYSNYTFVCGATLISDRFLLTAAHCIDDIYNDPSAIKIRLGEFQVNSFDELLPYEDFDVIGIEYHNAFNPKNVQNDIAVLELAHPVVFKYHINSVCLPPQGYQFPHGQRCIVSGWGKDSFKGAFQHILKKIEVPMVDKIQCQSDLRKTRLGKYFRLHESFICAGGEENKDACKGDGGGPLVCYDSLDGHWNLVGLTAWGIDCGRANVPGVYVDVAHFNGWIHARTNPGANNYG